METMTNKSTQTKEPGEGNCENRMTGVSESRNEATITENCVLGPKQMLQALKCWNNE